ncbi:O-methyltransferase [Aquipuribacter nitratireducens]|uniref:O-methyltransferase n=1 Tax=Aquipuribacter nitratireducens TaxID=650104 RepID=A0ABW0GLE9_9MICO
MSASKASSWTWTESWLEESPPVRGARERAGELGIGAVSTGGGALLTVLAAAVQARAVVDVGTGAGVSALRLLEGMPADGVLTSIDVEAEHTGAARAGLQAAGVRANRSRVIHGDAAAVLPRLADGGYDLVHVDVDDARVPGAVLPEAVRLLRPGGVLVVSDALARDRVPDPAQRDARTTAMRELLRAVHDDDRLLATVLPVGAGVLVAVRQPG